MKKSDVFAFLVLHFYPEKVNFGHNEMLFDRAFIFLSKINDKKKIEELYRKENAFVRANSSIVVIPLEFDRNKKNPGNSYEISQKTLQELLPYLLKNNNRKITEKLDSAKHFSGFSRSVG